MVERACRVGLDQRVVPNSVARAASLCSRSRIEIFEYIGSGNTMRLRSGEEICGGQIYSVKGRLGIFFPNSTQGSGYIFYNKKVEPMLPNLMLEKVTLTTGPPEVSSPPGQLPAPGPSSQVIPPNGSSHKLKTKTIPVSNALLNGSIPPVSSNRLVAFMIVLWASQYCWETELKGGMPLTWVGGFSWTRPF